MNILLLTAILLQTHFLCGMERNMKLEDYLLQPHITAFPYITYTHRSTLLEQPYLPSPYDIQSMPEFISSPDAKSLQFRAMLTPLLREYEKGDKIIAGNKLYGMYLFESERGTKNIPYLPYWIQQSLYNRISISQALQGNYTTAIEFTRKAHPNDDTAITNRGLYLTKLAKETANPLIQKHYYNEAFSCFEKAAPFDHIARKRYFYALINGIGCTSKEISNYFNQNIKSNKNEREKIAALKNFELFAEKGNMFAQCALAAAYYTGTNGLPQSIEKSLLLCRYYLQSLAQQTKIEELPLQRFIFDRILKDLSASNEKTIADQAQELTKYMNLFMANIAKDQKKIESIACGDLISKLLCKNYTRSSAYVQRIKTTKPDDERITNINEVEKSILKSMAAVILDHSTEKAHAINYLCGILAYNDKNYKKAYQHLAQCTSYIENDLLINYLIFESHYRMQKNDVLIIQKNLDIMKRINALIEKANSNQKPEERDAYAQSKIIALYQELKTPYGTNLLESQQYSLVYQFIDHLLPHKQTAESALSMLLKMERTINKDEHLIKSIDPQLRNDMDKHVDALIRKNLSTETLLTLTEFLSEKAARHSLSPEQKSNYLKHALGCLPDLKGCKNLVTTEWGKILRKKLLVTIGILDNSIPHLDEAIALGSLEAILQKIHIIMELPSHTPTQAEELIQLMTTLSTSDHPERFNVCNGLAFYYFSSSNMEDRKKAFDYLHESIAAGYDQYAFLLGSLYFQGIPNYVEADVEKALYYFNKQTVFNENISHNSLITLKCHAYYRQEKYQEALDLLTPNIPTEITPLRAECLWLNGAIKMQLFNAAILDSEVINYCVEAYNIFHQCPNKELAPIEIIQSITDEKFLKTAEYKTAHILLTNNKTAQNLEFCNIVGQLLWRVAKKAPLTDERRKSAIRYIRYAADNDNANAQEFVIHTDLAEINAIDKLFYLENAYAQRLQENSPKAETIQDLLDNFYQDTLGQQATIICNYIEKKNLPFLEKHISRLYITRSPLITLDMSQKIANILITRCYGDQFLVQAANRFLNDPAQATQTEKYAAVFLGSLLVYSDNQKQLLQAARYLDKVELHSAEQNQCIKDNLGIIYYKMGCLAGTNKTLATLYYQKGTDLGNQAANCALLRLAGINAYYVPKTAGKK